ncbi:uncharacterized protein [Euphorbia lathyris]|uniref:uncharacterized protein isoform X1 n=1 Tax=Euphorbia lathyris TaxID=212925 RepID=UPI0033134E45
MAAELDARRTEVLSNAAKTIQQRVRTYCARKRFIALRKAAIYIQALWRGRLACKKFEGMKREAGAIKIQKHVRRYEARKAYKNLHDSALLLQTGLRAMAAHKEYRFKLQTKAATIIQASVDSERPRAGEIKEETQKKVEQLQESLQRLEGNMPLPIESTSAFDQIIQRKGHAIDMDRMPMKRTLPVSNRLKPRGGRGRSSYENYTNQCLTMHQPWASLLIYGIKRIEGRSWPAPIRGRLWIHAASRVPEEATIKAMEDFYREIYAVNGITDIKFPEHYPVSRLLGCVEVVGCVRGEEVASWEAIPEGVRLEGQTDFCWLCERPQKLLVPFEMRGFKGVYNLGRKIHEAAVRGLTPVKGPMPVRFPLPNPCDPFSLKPGSISKTSPHKSSQVEKSSSLSAAIAGARAAATQFSKNDQNRLTNNTQNDSSNPRSSGQVKSKPRDSLDEVPNDESSALNAAERSHHIQDPGASSHNRTPADRKQTVGASPKIFAAAVKGLKLS